MGRSDSQPHNVPDADDRSRFVRTRISADAQSAAQARAGFANWLASRFSLGPERFNDVLLAVNEAIANAAEFAYVDAVQRGTLDVKAAYDASSDTLAVAVDDHGRWRTKVPQPAGSQQEFRGRGIPLMEALADELTIDRTPHGTHVTLIWTGLVRRGRDA
ncbi:ATP-binding protein [Mycobacterium saskatchewanense]|uniref:ATP-binding protein n=1 Tax=Mycobacterium saskatchewanense TaxID=220927 RepID=UPI0011547AA1